LILTNLVNVILKISPTLKCPAGPGFSFLAISLSVIAGQPRRNPRGKKEEIVAHQCDLRTKLFARVCQEKPANRFNSGGGPPQSKTLARNSPRLPVCAKRFGLRQSSGAFVQHRSQHRKIS
jgi:hypothetical protein